MKTSKLLQAVAIVASLGFLSSCSSIPKGVTAYKPFEKERYLGKWYEIARIDFKYEKDLNNTTAEYSINSDGTIKVNNQGYNTKTNEWQQAIGKAKFIGSDTIAMLKVSFFGPFYAGYNVIAIDPDYTYALVAGKNHKYLWILSRTTTIPEEVKQNYLKIAQESGYNTSDLLWIEQDKQK